MDRIYKAVTRGKKGEITNMYSIARNMCTWKLLTHPESDKMAESTTDTLNTTMLCPESKEHQPPGQSTSTMGNTSTSTGHLPDKRDEAEKSNTDTTIDANTNANTKINTDANTDTYIDVNTNANTDASIHPDIDELLPDMVEFLDPDFLAVEDEPLPIIYPYRPLHRRRSENHRSRCILEIRRPAIFDMMF